jgi:hypothetical protein
MHTLFEKAARRIVFGVAVFIFTVLASPALAGKAALSWTAPTTNSDGSALEDLAGYKVYWGTTTRTGTTAPGGYANSYDVGNATSYTVETMADTGTTYFSVSAYDNASTPNESLFSNEVHKTPGDVDTDGDVDIFDYNTLKDNFGQTGQNVADVDLDNSVGIFDYNALKDNFGAQV